MSLSINKEMIKTYAVSILVPLVLGAIVGVLTTRTMHYENLNKPFLAPPAILFPIAWTILYPLMGISHGMLKWSRLSTPDTEAIYYAQLIVNLIWPILFFSLEWRLFSFIWIILLDILVITMALKFYRKDKTAGLLQIPYCLWLIFASYLNLATYLLNR